MSLSNPFQQALSLYLPPPAPAGGVTLLPLVNPLSLTEVDYTVPSSVKVVTLTLAGLKSNSGRVVIQGNPSDGGTVYTGLIGFNNWSGSAFMSENTTDEVYQGLVSIYTIDTATNTYYIAGTLFAAAGISRGTYFSGGTMVLTSPLTTVRVTTSDGSQFATGTVVAGNYM